MSTRIVLNENEGWGKVDDSMDFLSADITEVIKPIVTKVDSIHTLQGSFSLVFILFVMINKNMCKCEENFVKSL